MITQSVLKTRNIKECETRQKLTALNIHITRCLLRASKNIYLYPQPHPGVACQETEPVSTPVCISHEATVKNHQKRLNLKHQMINYNLLPERVKCEERTHNVIDCCDGKQQHCVYLINNNRMLLQHKNLVASSII